MSTATWLYTLLAVLLDGCAALVAGLVPERWIARARDGLLGFATGVLLRTSFLGVLPEAIAQLRTLTALETVLGTLVVMVLLEWAVHQSQSNPGRAADVRSGAGGRRLPAVLLAADAFHNAADGAAIAAAFLASPRLGAITAAAVMAHEVPEEIAAFLVLRSSGMSRASALAVLVGVQLTAALGAMVTFLASTAWRGLSGFALAIAAGTFLHIAEVDLIPALLESSGTKRRLQGLIGFVLGAVLIIPQSV